MDDLRSRARPATFAGVGLIALATLMYELLLTRIFSVTMWYHFAFVAVSMAMFGMTTGALVVFLRPGWFPPARVKDALAIAAAAMSIVMVFSFLTMLSVPFLVHPSIVAIYGIAFTYAVGAFPFVASGIAICLALTRFPRQVSQLYAVDLLGAAAGCVLLIWLLRITDGPTAVIAVAALTAVSAVCFALDAGRPRALRWTFLLAATMLLAAAGHTVLVQRQFPVLRILFAKGSFEPRPLYEKWNSYSRVRVIGDPRVPEMPYARTLSPTYQAHPVPELRMDIDVAASTAMLGFSGDLHAVDFLRYDVTNIGHYLRPTPRVLVVGTGGGRDLLAALAFGAESVTGVEINRDIVATLNGRFGDFSGHLDRNPRVHFVNDEARSYVARSREPFDFIQISLIDTWAATAAGAFVLSENSVYTVEAWRIFLEHLAPAGTLSVSRWHVGTAPAEVYRLVALATRSLEAVGVDRPRDHLVLIRTRAQRPTDVGVATLLVSRTPLGASDVDRLERSVDRLGFETVLSPQTVRDETVDRLVSTDAASVMESYPVNIAAPTDDSPFFFQMLRLRDVLRLRLLDAGKSSPNMAAVFVLTVLLATVIVLSIGCIFLPLRLATDRRSLSDAGALLTFFAAIGLGFMLIETSQMQRLMIVLGHPTYGLSVVLFALLISAGTGSLFTARVPMERAARAGRVALMCLVVALVIFGFITPAMTHAFEAASTTVRIGVAVVLLFPPGLLMGMAFPLGMKLAATGRSDLTPWLWGVNGAFSVSASVLAIVIALGASISAAFWTGVAAYAMAAAAFWRSSTAGAPARRG
jgi:SAM-dependent methyltransferase